MQELQRQVQQARRRLTVQQWLSTAFWTLCAALLIAALAIAATKIWPLEVDGQQWAWWWLGGSVSAGLLVSWLVTLWRRRSALDAAIEIDHRFGLKERVSSCLTLSDHERESDAGQALIDDAVRRVSEVNVSEEFRVEPSRWALVPALLAVLAFGLTLLSDAQPENAPQTAQAATLETKQRVQNSTEALKKRMEERRARAVEQGLEDAGELFKKLEQGVDSLQKQEQVDRQKAMVKLNDLASEVKDRQSKLGSRDEIRKQLDRLKDLKQGPADKMAQAVKDGDFQAAMEAAKELQDKINDGNLSEEDKKQLQEQLQQLKDKLQQMAEAHEQAKQDLQREIQEKLAQGDREAANQLQQQLDQLNRQDKQMDQISKMAKSLADCASCLQQGQAQNAAQALADVAANLEAMQAEMEELEMLEEALDQIAQARDSMNCSSCNGMGCSMCTGMGTNGMPGQMPGMGLGEGQGQGDRPEEETGTGFYESQVRAKLDRGNAYVAGTASGPNRSGQALEEIKSEIASTRQTDEDPLTGQRLPKPQRELTRQYFNAVRQGE